MEGYPKAMYHKIGGGSALVMTPEQEKTLGPDWQAFPAHIQDRVMVSEEKPRKKAKQEIEAT